jgi:hypothetical protein
MFLWVVLQIKALCLERTDTALHRAIAHLSSDLSKLYEIILEKSKAASDDYQTKIMDLVISACRPLTILAILSLCFLLRVCCGLKGSV